MATNRPWGGFGVAWRGISVFSFPPTPISILNTPPLARLPRAGLGTPCYHPGPIAHPEGPLFNQPRLSKPPSGGGGRACCLRRSPISRQGVSPSQSEQPGLEITNWSAAATTWNECARRTNLRFDPFGGGFPILLIGCWMLGARCWMSRSRAARLVSLRTGRCRRLRARRWSCSRR